jgi:hypothetical protein
MRRPEDAGCVGSIVQAPALEPGLCGAPARFVNGGRPA